MQQDLSLTPEQLVTFSKLAGIVDLVVGKLIRTFSFNEDDAEDARQDGFVGLCQAIKTHKPESGSLSGWCRSVVWGTVVDGVRRRHGRPGRRHEKARRPVSLSTPSRQSEFWGTKREIGALLPDNKERPPTEAVDDLDAVAYALSRISTKDREALQAYFYDYKSTNEIADATGMDRQTARQTLLRGLDTMRKAIDAECPKVRYLPKHERWRAHS